MKYLLLIAISFLFASGCTETRTRFDFQIVNETDFHINNLEFRYHDFTDNFELGPNDSTSIFNLDCTSEELLGPCTVNIRIEEFVDDGILLSNTCGLGISRLAFNDREKVIFTISDDGEPSDSCPNNIFRITY